MTVVTNVTELSRAMRTALLEEHAALGTADALFRRGLLVAPFNGRRGGHVQFNLTEAGRRVAEAIRAEMDNTPIVTAGSIACLKVTDNDLAKADEPSEVKKLFAARSTYVPPVEDLGKHAHAYCYGMLRKTLELAGADANPTVAQALEHCRATLTASGYEPSED